MMGSKARELVPPAVIGAIVTTLFFTLAMVMLQIFVGESAEALQLDITNLMFLAALAGSTSLGGFIAAFFSAKGSNDRLLAGTLSGIFSGMISSFFIFSVFLLLMASMAGLFEALAEGGAMAYQMVIELGTLFTLLAALFSALSALGGAICACLFGLKGSRLAKVVSSALAKTPPSIFAAVILFNLVGILLNYIYDAAIPADLQPELSALAIIVATLMGLALLSFACTSVVSELKHNRKSFAKVLQAGILESKPVFISLLIALIPGAVLIAASSMLFPMLGEQYLSAFSGAVSVLIIGASALYLFGTTFVPQAALLSKGSPISAIRHSLRFVRKNFWEALSLYVLLSFFGVAVFLLVSLVTIPLEGHIEAMQIVEALGSSIVLAAILSAQTRYYMVAK